MGCVGSKAAGGDGSAEKHPNVFRVVNVNHEGDDLWCGQLEVTSSNLTLYRKRKPPTKWPLQCLRRYGYDNDTFIFEAGRRCDSGEGIYSFRCRRADVLFHLLQDFIQESTYNNNNNNNNSLTVSSMDEVVQQTQERMDADVAELRRAMGAGTTTTTNNAQQTTTTGGSNYIILHGNNAAMAHGNSRSPCHSPASASNTHNNNNNISSSSNNNYLEPFENGTNATATPTVTMTSETTTTTTTNPNSNIYTNSMMIPQAQLSPAAAAAASSTKKSDPLECSPGNRPALLATSDSLMQLRLSMDGTGSQSQATSPVATAATTAEDPSSTAAAAALNTYMNVTPGEMILMAQSTTATTGNGNTNPNWRYSRMNSNTSNATTATAITERCYENLDAATISAVLVNSASAHGITGSSSASSSSGGVAFVGNGRAGGGGRHSRPDIFSKVDLPLLEGSLSSAGAMRMSEPCTPTGMGGSSAQQRKVNYIVLDLDSQSVGLTGVGGSSGSAAAAIATATPTATAAAAAASMSNLLTPESPKKRQTLGYATIDFNKTVALSNSTNPTCESEASRKTRF